MSKETKTGEPLEKTSSDRSPSELDRRIEMMKIKIACRAWSSGGAVNLLDIAEETANQANPSSGKDAKVER